MLRTTIAMRNMILSLPLMKKHMNKLNSIFRGALKLMRRSIWKAFWILLTSVVILVTRPAVEYLSISENEKVWIFSYIAILRLAASPDEE